MADGIAIEVEGGFARIEFLDKTKRGDALAALLRVGGPAMIDVDTRSGPRKVYIVPESIAAEAGLLEPAQQVLRPDYPEGEPEEAWTVPQLRAYAFDKDISLGDATKKADILAVLVPPADPEPPVDTDTSE